MANQKKAQVVITANAAMAKKIMDELNERIAKLKKKMDALDVSTKEGKKEFNKLQKEMLSYNSAAVQNITNTERIDKAVKNLSKTSLADLKRALSAAKSELNKMSADSKGLKTMQNNVKTLQAQIDKLQGSTQKASNSFESLVKHGLQMIAMYAGINQVIGKVKSLIESNLELSDSLADIRKVSGLAIEEINGLSKALQKIDTRVPQQKLNELAYAGAKLGLGQYGANGLLQFTTAATQLQAALGEDMGEEALTQLSKMAQVMGDMKSMGVEQSLMAIGSSIFQLSTTTTSTGNNIMHFAQRLMGLGKTAKMTSAEILAIGSAADSMGLMPEVAATAMNKFISTLQGKYGQVAKAVGIPEETLKSLLEAGKTMDAMVIVFERLHSMGGLNALVPILGDLGGEGARLLNVLASMAANVSMLEDQLETSNKAFEEATAITNEYNIQNETAAALMERASNMWEKAFVNPDSIDIVKELAKAWYDVSKSLTQNEAFVSSLRVAMEGLVLVLRMLISTLPIVISYFAVFVAQKAIVGIVSGLSMAFGAFGTSMGMMALRTQAFISSLFGLNKSFIESTRSALYHAQIMLENAVFAKKAAEENWKLAATEEEMVAAEAELIAADKALALARQELITQTGLLSAATNVEASVLLEENGITGAVILSETDLAIAKEMETVATEAQAVAESDLTAKKLYASGVTKEYTATTTAQTTAMSGLGSKSMWLMGVMALLVTSLFSLIDKMKSFETEEEKAKKVNDRLAESLAIANTEYNTEKKHLDDLSKKLKDNWNDNDQRRLLIDQINSRYSDYLDNLLSEKMGYDQIRVSINNATDALREYYFYRQKEALKGELVQDVQKEGAKAYMSLQQNDESFAGISMEFMQGAIQEYKKQGYSDALSITKAIWKDIKAEDAPSDGYLDLRKLPLVGTLAEGSYNKRDAYNKLNEFVVATIKAENNDALIEQNFPGEFKPRKHEVAYSYTPDSKGTPHPTRPTTNPSQTTTTNPAAEAKADIKQFMSYLSAYYNLQLAGLTDKLANTDATEQEQKTAIGALQQRRREAFISARETFVYGTQDWAKFKNTLKDDWQVEVDNMESMNLLASIMAEDLINLHNQIQAETVRTTTREKVTAIKGTYEYFKNQKEKQRYGTLGYSKSSSTTVKTSDNIEAAQTIMAAQFDEASKDELKGAKENLERMNARIKETLEHDYTGLVDKNTVNGLELLGFVNIDPTSPYVKQMRKNVTDLLVNVRENISKVMESYYEGEGSFFNTLFGNDYKNVIKNSPFSYLLNATSDEVELFYNKLLQYNDEYVQALRKRSNEQKKIVEYMWSILESKKLAEERISMASSRKDIFGDQSNLLAKFGMTDIGKEPSIKILQMKLELAQDYYDFVKTHTTDEILIEEAQKKVRDALLEQIKQEVALMKQRAEAIDTFMQPTYKAIESLGDVWIAYRKSSEEGQQALLDSLRTFIKEYSSIMIKGIGEQMKRKILNSIALKRIAKENNVDRAELSIRAKRRKKKGKNEIGEVMATTDQPDESLTDTFKAEMKKRGMEDYATDATSPVDAQIGIDNALLDEARVFHSQMLSEEALYQEMLQKIRENPENKDSIMAEYETCLTAEKDYSKEQVAIRKAGFEAMKKLSLAGWQSLLKNEKEGNEKKAEITETTEQGITEVTAANESTRLATQQATQSMSLNSFMEKTVGDVLLGIAGGSAKTVGELGWWGLPLVGVLSAALMGLLNYALSFVGNIGGGSSKSGPNTKLVSGMLTYDSGNVQTYAGTDGNYYSAQPVSRLSTGIVTSPIATTVNGAPALVGERGPEIVVGRETTAAIMRNDPGLLRMLVGYDKMYSGRRRTYDEGNVSAVSLSGNTLSDTQVADIMMKLLYRLDNPIAPNINMYGRDGLHAKMQQANQFMKGK